jgi:hypothetical protein
MICCCRALAQQVDGKAMAEIDAEYIVVTVISKNMGSKYIVEVDYGQYVSNSILKDNVQPRMVDDKGKNVEFNSPAAVLNYFRKCGYYYMEAIGGSSGGWSPSQKFVFERRNEKI